MSFGGSGKVRLLITDLDNTLYDWVSFYVPVFYAMVEVAAATLNVAIDELLDDFRDVHVGYQNTEQPFALLETRAVRKKFPYLNRAELAEVMDPAFHAFNSERKRRLRLYPDVWNTLALIKRQGTRIVAHTEASSRNSLFRTQTLGLGNLVEKIYAPKTLGLGHPKGEVREKWSGAIEVVFLPDHHRKPDPRVLRDICESFSASTDEALYVGDSLTRDIMMANRAGVRSAWAHYGGIYDPTLWAQLVRVTHWTEKDVQRERDLKERARDVRPDAELGKFSDILHFFAFGS